MLRRHPSEVERGRRHVAQACAGLHDDLVMAATLLASELITNALRHGSGDITVLVTTGRGEIRVVVADECGTEPKARSANIEDESGRGLLIVETLADDWGCEDLPQGGGKTVWFSLRL